MPFHDLGLRDYLTSLFQGDTADDSASDDTEEFHYPFNTGHFNDLLLDTLLTEAPSSADESAASQDEYSLNFDDAHLFENLQTCNSQEDCPYLHQECLISDDHLIGLCGCQDGFTLDFHTWHCMRSTDTTTFSPQGFYFTPLTPFTLLFLCYCLIFFHCVVVESSLPKISIKSE